MPRPHPYRESNRPTHAVVTGEPDDRETIKSGSAGGHTEKGQLTLAPRRVADPTAWHNAFNRLQRCYERKEDVVNAYFDLADAVITIRSLIRQAWILYRWDTRPTRRP